jgi:hypothetical protein
MLKIKQTFVMGIHCAGNQSIKTISLKLSNSGTVSIQDQCLQNPTLTVPTWNHNPSIPIPVASWMARSFVIG